MARYIYDACEYGSWHEGGLGSTDNLAKAISKAAALLRGHADGYASVEDSRADAYAKVRCIRINMRDCAKRLTPRRALLLLRQQATEAGWLRPANRPRRDPGAARINKSYMLHPTNAARVEAEAKRTGESQSDVINRLVQGLDHG